MENFIFIYEKQGKIKAVGLEEGKIVHDDLISDGWEHTKTIDGCRYIEFLHNVSADATKEIKSLSKKENE